MKTKNLVLMALLIALSFVGSNLRIFGSIAFDSLPGFLAALLFGPIYGAAIGLIGHLLTAFNSGLPLSLPLHFVVAVTMAITMYGYGSAYKALIKRFSESVTFILTGVVGTILNAPVSLLFSMGVLWLIGGSEAALGLLVLLPILTAASIANIVLATILFKFLGKHWDKE